MTDQLEKIIRPIVEGQIRSFTFDHPEVIEVVKWFKPRSDKRVTFVNSLAKRIVRDLLCPTTRARLVEALADNLGGESKDALVELYDCEGSHGVDCGMGPAAAGDGVELAAAPSPIHGSLI